MAPRTITITAAGTQRKRILLSLHLHEDARIVIPFTTCSDVIRWHSYRVQGRSHLEEPLRFRSGIMTTSSRLWATLGCQEGDRAHGCSGQVGRADHGHTLGWVRRTDYPRFSTDPARTLLLAMSDYERLVELAAKGMAERDNYPMPKSVTTPEAFYEVMACAALDAMGLQALLEELARAERELKDADEGPALVVDADVAAPFPEEPSAPPPHVLTPPPTDFGHENGVAVIHRADGSKRGGRPRMLASGASERLLSDRPPTHGCPRITRG